MEALEVLQPGSMTTIQDLGRYGYQQYGVSVSGAMDKFAFRIGNILLGNDEGEAGIEATITGPRLKALQELKVAITGGNLSPEVNGIPAPMWQSFILKKGDILFFKGPKSGCRAYLAIAGGIELSLVMRSRSTHIRSELGGFGRALIKGDVIRIGNLKEGQPGMRTTTQLMKDQVPVPKKDWLIRVVPGPQCDYFSRKGLETFFGEEYLITTEADRMGYRLKGPKIEHSIGPDIITDATPPGSVQVPGNGMPIILLADAQTTGGYSKIAVVISTDQDLLGQAKPGDRVRFEKVNVLQARQILLEYENNIKEIKKSLIHSSG